ncbi:MAG: aldehyde dehydrogenase family protein [Anaerolineae bacterium]|nr:aldehyde dehydrogenase family protein [Anaerolineae bacterium]
MNLSTTESPFDPGRSQTAYSTRCPTPSARLAAHVHRTPHLARVPRIPHSILRKALKDMAIVREEIFWPVLVATPFESLDELAARANATPFGLAAGIWTKDLSRAHKLAGLLKAGTVWINSLNAFDAASPFGGYKQSGFGREMGHEALELYTQVKSVWVGL